jgi:hypothetical protein
MIWPSSNHRTALDAGCSLGLHFGRVAPKRVSAVVNKEKSKRLTLPFPTLSPPLPLFSPLTPVQNPLSLFRILAFQALFFLLTPLQFIVEIRF